MSVEGYLRRNKLNLWTRIWRRRLGSRVHTYQAYTRQLTPSQRHFRDTFSVTPVAAPRTWVSP